MGVLTDFYLADPATAKDYNDDQTCLEIDRAQYKGITPLELSTLAAIIRNKQWDVSMMREFPNILVVDGGERLIYEISGTAVQLFAGLSEMQISEAAAAWSKTDELACEPENILPLIKEIVRLSKRGLETKRSLYLWICV